MTHEHRFVPAPAGRLYGKVRYRNTCACGQLQNPEPPNPLVRGPWCLRCGTPTVAGTVDPNHPLHPCCAEPELMVIADAAWRRHRSNRLRGKPPRRRMSQPTWWRDDPDVTPCPLCRCPIQRIFDGTLHDGLTKHYAQVHPNRRPPTDPETT